VCPFGITVGDIATQGLVAACGHVTAHAAMRGAKDLVDHGFHPMSVRTQFRYAAVLLALAVGIVRPAAAGPALLFDAKDNKVLYAEDQDDAWYPASLTKLMTAYITFEALKQGTITLDTKLTASELANSQPPSKIGLPVGAQMDIELALQSLIIKSANDVAVMLAEGISGTQDAFVVRMNATAKRLGMSRTAFVNPNGLPAPEQITTARDLAKLSAALLAEYPQYAPLWGMADMHVGRIRIRTHNALLKIYEGADGMKTGFTCDSGFNVVATATRDGHRLVAVVLGESSGASRSLRAANLLEHGFQYRAWEEVLKPITLSSLEMATDARAAAISVRDTVSGYACGGRKRPAVVKARQKRLEAVRQKAAATQQAATKGKAQPAAAPTAGVPPAPAVQAAPAPKAN
jgi:D-alanyl-D-alanine carboxypeptidase